MSLFQSRMENDTSRSAQAREEACTTQAGTASPGYAESRPAAYISGGLAILCLHIGVGAISQEQACYLRCWVGGIVKGERMA